MLFNSNEFLFLFLPVALIAFHGLRVLGIRNYAFLALLLASIYFYAYWSVPYALVFIVSVVFNFLIGRGIMATGSRMLTAAGIIANLLLLGYFKYTNFLIEVIGEMGLADLPHLEIVLPIGISFYTFIQIAYLADICSGKAVEAKPVRYGLFVSFFPHMLAGPVVHHKEMMPQFAEAMPRQRLLRMLAVGSCLLVIGLVKKVLVADRIAMLANAMFAAAADGGEVDFFNAWVGILAYTLQIYFDFSGYSDMATGLALMFGIRFPANFNSPYRSTNIIAFWRRWHMTLSRLLRDYIYIPLGGNRKGPARRHMNLMATMVIGGAWHGAGWPFILWGFLHGLYLMINHFWNYQLGNKIKMPPILAMTITFLAVVIAWVPFRATDMQAVSSIYAAMLGLNGLSAPLELGTILGPLGMDPRAWGIEMVAANQRAQFYMNCSVLLLGMVLAFGAPNSIRILRRYRPVLNTRAVLLDGRSRNRLEWRPGLWSGILLGIGLFLVVRSINSAAPSEFLYFQF
ncbi:MBOAT family protein [Sphingobium sp. AS12]|uniref:MBOAT family O-acyltransferase n=1 Tax=Sphingobium sp. AS12 TaxID=2849495 RepID=UPI001C31785B|nr:MBOAT family protein [Sphingobium sp. AS12]MBV2150151.1 MBOAT family protein [Sphingobium sp. AS12]